MIQNEKSQTTPLGDSYLLIFNAILGGIGGFSFWIIASWYFLPSEIGLVTTIISISVFLSTLAEFGLGDSLKTYVPSSKKENLHSLLDSTFSIVFLNSTILLSVFSLLIASGAYLSEIDNSFLIAFFVLVGGVVKSCYPLVTSSLVSSLRIKPVVLSTLILHAFGICALLIFGKAMGSWDALGLLSMWVASLVVSYIVLILSFSRSIRGGYIPKFKFVREDLSRVKSLSLANLLLTIRMPVILAISSAFILDEWGPLRAAEFYFLWRASELAMMIPTSFSIASLVHRGHGRIIESVLGLLPMVISSLSSLFVLIGLLIMLPMFDGLFEDIQFSSILPWSLVVIPTHVLMMNVSDWRFNEQSNLINFTSLGTLALFLASLLTVTEEPSQIGWFWFFSVSFVGFSGLAYRKLFKPPLLL